MFSWLKKEYEIYKLINHKVEISNGFRNIPKIELSPYEILVGESYGKPLTINMKSTPHLLITGLSGQGKSKMVNCIIHTMNKNTRAVLINGFVDDYDKGIRNIIGDENISKFFSRLLEDKKLQRNPLYILIEEMGIIQDKKILKMIGELLMVGRHYNIFIIGIIQVSRAEDIKFKTFFNARISFRQVDSSSYAVALGCSIPKEDSTLSKREFYLLTDNLYKGKTYNMNWRSEEWNSEQDLY